MLFRLSFTYSSFKKLGVIQSQSILRNQSSKRTAALLSGCSLQERGLSCSCLRLQADAEGEEQQRTEDENKPQVPPEKDRSKKIPVEVSMKYMESQAYRETYGDALVWQLYRRVHKYGFPPRKTRKTCIRHNVISTGSPCPICRDEYLVPDYRNLKLLKQFISPYSNEVIDPYYTGVCRKQQFALEVQIEKARDYGLLDFYVPKRQYNYEDFYAQPTNAETSESSK